MSIADVRTVPRNGLGLSYVVSVLVVAVAYVVFARLGLSLAFATKQVTAVWPPTGIALSALLLGGYRLWPGVWLGAFVANATVSEPIYVAAGIACGNTLGPLLGAYLLKRFAAFDRALARLRDVLSLVLLGSVVAMTVTATCGVSILAAAGMVPWSGYGPVWWLWWMGDAMGVLLVAPLILTWSTFGLRDDLKKSSVLEIVALGAALIVTTWLSFMSSLPLAYPVYPFVIWTALRFGQRATTLAIVVISTIAIWGTIRGLGPFTSGTLDHRLLLLVTFMAVLALTGLVLCALSAERRTASTEADAAQKRFQVLAEVMPQMVWTANATGWIDWYNHRWYEYTGQTPEEAAGWGWQRAHHPEIFPRVMHDWPRSIATGASFDMESRIRQRDGSYRWFLMRAEPLRDASGAVVRWYGTYTDIDDQKRELQQTTRVAETLRAAFLAGKLPERADLRFDAIYLTAEREALIGGDWYDAFELPDGHIVVSIGDVVGHGVGAAIAAGRIRQGIFAIAFDSADPAIMLAKVNRMLQAQAESVATALVAVVDPDLRSLKYATAGHPPPIIADSSSAAQSLPFGGLPLGVDGVLDVANHVVALEKGAVILFYTDGISEFRKDILAAEKALYAAASRLFADKGITHPATALQREVMGSDKPSDDAVLVVLQLSPAPASSVLDQTDTRKTWTFHSSDAYTAHSSRHELMKFIRRFGIADEDLFRTELIIGELLANTVEHAPGLVKVEVDWRGVNPVLTILDAGPGLIRFMPSLPSDSLREGGRGLFLIGTMSGDVRVAAMPGGGTKMTVVLPARRELTAPQTSPLKKSG